MGVRLPSEYQEVEYLDSASALSPYIDTGIPITEDLTFEIDFQLSDITSRKYFMGGYNGTDFYLYVGVSKYFQTAFGATYNDTTLTADIQRHKFIYQINNGTLIVKDSSTTILTKNISSFSGNSILVAGTTAAPSASIPCKTFESKMTKAGVVIQDLIPCYRKSDSKPGMYDLVTNQFFTNAGTGDFLVGPDVINSISPWLVAWRRALMTHGEQIPDEYVFYDYIEYIPGSYLDTLYTPTSSPEIVTRIQIMSTADADIFGFRQNVFPSFIVDPSNRGAQWYNRWGDVNYSKFGQQITSIADCTFGQHTVIDGVPKIEFEDVDWSTNNQSILVGAGRNDSCDVQVYSFKLYDGDALVRDMVACMRLRDNAIGMYDNVTQLFYKSAGSATPTLGNIN